MQKSLEGADTYRDTIHPKSRRSSHLEKENEERHQSGLHLQKHMMSRLATPVQQIFSIFEAINSRPLFLITTTHVLCIDHSQHSGQLLRPRWCSELERSRSGHAQLFSMHVSLSCSSALGTAHCLPATFLLGFISIQVLRFLTHVRKSVLNHTVDPQ